MAIRRSRRPEPRDCPSCRGQGGGGDDRCDITVCGLCHGSGEAPESRDERYESDSREVTDSSTFPFSA
jgi:DnaJ-class molecular chaperone